jgi:hypothetical protein
VLTCERLELGGQITGATMLVNAGFVVCGPELAEPEVGVREQVVDDGQRRINDGDDGLGLTATPGQAYVESMMSVNNTVPRTRSSAASAWCPARNSAIS